MRPWQRREAEGSDTIADVTETRNLYQADVKPFTLLVKYQARWSLRCTTTRVKKFVYWGRNAREAITKKSAKNCCSCSLRPHQWWVTIQKNMYWKSSVLHVQALQFSSFTNKLQERNHLAPPHDITSLPSLTPPLHPLMPRHSRCCHCSVTTLAPGHSWHPHRFQLEKYIYCYASQISAISLIFCLSKNEILLNWDAVLWLKLNTLKEFSDFSTQISC